MSWADREHKTRLDDKSYRQSLNWTRTSELSAQDRLDRSLQGSTGACYFSSFHFLQANCIIYYTWGLSHIGCRNINAHSAVFIPPLCSWKWIFKQWFIVSTQSTHSSPYIKPCIPLLIHELTKINCNHLLCSFSVCWQIDQFSDCWFLSMMQPSCLVYGPWQAREALLPRSACKVSEMKRVSANALPLVISGCNNWQQNVVRDLSSVTSLRQEQKKDEPINKQTCLCTSWFPVNFLKLTSTFFLL